MNQTTEELQLQLKIALAELELARYQLSRRIEPKPRRPFKAHPPKSAWDNLQYEGKRVCDIAREMGVSSSAALYQMKKRGLA